MPIQHAKLSASGSARWLNCPASVRESEQYIKCGSSSFAEEGTCAHQLAEICLKSGDFPDIHLGKKLSDAPNVAVDASMVEHVQGYIDFCKAFDGEMVVEERVDFSPWVPDGFGTSDCIVFNDDKCTIIDLKYGQGVEVDAENNTQAMLYALGVYNEYGFINPFTEFELIIYQPRRDHVSRWSIEVCELLEWADWVKGRAELCFTDNAPYAPSEDACRWCPHMADCSALLDHTQNVIGSMFDDLDLPKPESVNVELVLKSKTLIESWLNAVERVAFEKAMNGEQVPGFKLVAGISRRKWGDEKHAEKLLLENYDADALYTKKFVSVTQAEKIIGKAKFNADFKTLVVKPEGKPTLAPNSDKRPSIDDVSNIFEEIED